MISYESRDHLLEALSDPKTLHLIVKEAFEIADKDNNGYIDKEEFEICVKNVSDFFGNLTLFEEKENEFKRLDKDNNGIIDFLEFKEYVKEIVEQILFS